MKENLNFLGVLGTPFCEFRDGIQFMGGGCGVEPGFGGLGPRHVPLFGGFLPFHMTEAGGGWYYDGLFWSSGLGFVPWRSVAGPPPGGPSGPSPVPGGPAPACSFRHGV